MAEPENPTSNFAQTDQLVVSTNLPDKREHNQGYSHISQLFF